MSRPTLAHAFVAAPGAPPSRWALFLHGIFGSGANWRTFARRLTNDCPDWGVVLVDLRMHGASQNFEAPHTLDAAATDIDFLANQVPGPVRAVVGHSFGGKVALAWTARRQGDLDVSMLVDSTPSARPDGRGSQSTLHVLETLESLPRHFPTREVFFEHMARANIDDGIAQWLAMNVRAADDGFRFRVDLVAVRALLENYFERDLWNLLERPPGRVVQHVVIGGRSDVFSAEDRARAVHAAAMHPDRVVVRVIEEAGHWVHVDAPDALFSLVRDAFR